MSTTTMIPAALWLAVATVTAAAQAQAIYRCGDSYSQQPCAGAKAVLTEPSLPTPAERKQSAAATQRDAQLADGLERERLQREAQPAQLYVPPPKSDTPFEPHKWPEKAATRKLDLFTASAPAARPAQPKKAGKSRPGKKAKAAAGQPPSPDGKAGAGGTLAIKR